MKEKNILIYEEDKETLKFLRSFFRRRNDYFVCFIKTDKKALKRELIERMHAALIIISPDGLEQIKPSDVGCPVIAMISGNVTNGIRAVVNTTTPVS